MLEVGLARLEDLELFEKNLKFMSELMDSKYRLLRSQIAQVNNSWQDRENAKFMEDFLPQADNVIKIAEQMMEYSRFVHRKIEALRLYTNK